MLNKKGMRTTFPFLFRVKRTEIVSQNSKVKRVKKLLTVAFLAFEFWLLTFSKPHT